MVKKTNVIIAILFLGWCFAHFVTTPWLGKYERDFVREVEKRDLAAFPPINHYAGMVNRYLFKLISEALTDRMALRSSLIMAKRNLDFRLFHRRDYGFVDVGKSGWLFIRDAYIVKNETSQWVAHVLERIENFIKNYPDNEPEFLLVIPPDKHSIYPEMVSEQIRTYIDRGHRRGETLRRHIEAMGSERVLGLWNAYAEAKQSVSEKLFYQTDTHHTPTGSLIMCRGIIDAIQPGIWREQEVVNLGEEFFCGDLTLMMGLNRKKEKRYWYDIQRRDVQKISESRLEPKLELKGLLQYRSESSGPPMITGKTLFLHDSMVAYSRETLRQFFTDISFVHYDRIAGEESFEAFMQGYDRIILGIAERVVLETMDNLLDSYHYEKLFEAGEADIKQISTNTETTFSLQVDGMHVLALGNNPSIYFPAHHLDYCGEYQVSIAMDSQVNTESQLFYQDSHHQSFEAVRCRNKSVTKGKNYLTFNLPAESLYYPKRFDPSMQPGEYVMSEFTLRRLADQTTYSKAGIVQRKSWVQPILVTAHQGQILSAWNPMINGNPTTRCKTSPGGMLVEAGTDDPYFILPPLTGEFTGTHLRLILELEALTGSTCQVFYLRPGMENYNEQNSEQVLVTTGLNRIEFRLEPDVLAYPMRIDPVTGKGRYLIRSARIVGLHPLVQSNQVQTPAVNQTIAHIIYPSIPIKIMLPRELNEMLVPENDVAVTVTTEFLELKVLGTDAYLTLSPQLEKIDPGYYKIIFSLHSPRDTTAQLFWLEKHKQNYTEAQSQRYLVKAGDNLIEFVVPAEAFEKPLRFDMASHVGQYQLQNMIIERITLSGDGEKNRRQHVSK